MLATTWSGCSCSTYPGPFLNIGVLSEVFPQGLNPEDRALTDELRGELAAWEDAVGARLMRTNDSSPSCSSGCSTTGAYVEDGNGIAAELREHRVTLRPDAVVTRGGEPAVLLTQYPASESLAQAQRSAGFHASPAERMRLLLRGAGVQTGLVSNGRSWVLVTPHAAGAQPSPPGTRISSWRSG